MGCKSAAKFKLEEETVASSSSSSSSSLFYSTCKQAIQSPFKRKTIQEHDGIFNLGDEEENEESNTAVCVLSRRSFLLRENSGTSVIADDSVAR